VVRFNRLEHLFLVALRDNLQSGPDLPIDYIGLGLGPQDPRGLLETVVRIDLISRI